MEFIVSGPPFLFHGLYSEMRVGWVITAALSQKT